MKTVKECTKAYTEHTATKEAANKELAAEFVDAATERLYTAAKDGKKEVRIVLSSEEHELAPLWEPMLAELGFKTQLKQVTIATSLVVVSF